jgi:hypothetical protein
MISSILLCKVSDTSKDKLFRPGLNIYICIVILHTCCQNTKQYNLAMTHCIKVKARDLLRELFSLDIDEGLRIESSSKGTRLFVNKSAAATFVLQLCNNKAEKVNRNNNNFIYFDSAEDVIKFIKTKFGRNFSIWSY